MQSASSLVPPQFQQQALHAYEFAHAKDDDEHKQWQEGWVRQRYFDQHLYLTEPKWWPLHRSL